MFELYRWIANFYLPPPLPLPCPGNIVTKHSSQYGNERFVHNWVEVTLARNLWLDHLLYFGSNDFIIFSIMRPLNLIWKEVVVVDVGKTKNNPLVHRMSRPTMGALYSPGA